MQPLNREGHGITLYKESPAIAAQRLVDQAREEERGRAAANLDLDLQTWKTQEEEN